jgi:ribose transport system permease protein
LNWSRALAAGWGVPLLTLIVLVGAIEALRPDPLTIDTLGVKVAANLTLILVATGQTIVIVRGGIDLSVGGTLSLASAIAATRAEGSGLELLPWLIGILIAGAAVGAINGLLISGLRLQPFLITLATWSIVEGVALIVQPSEGGKVPDIWFAWGYSTIAGVPISIVLLALLCVWWAWFSRTRLFNAIRAAGSNERGAFLNRVSLVGTNVAAYGLAGLFAGLAGVFYATQTGAGSPTVGAQYVLPAIAAVVIGGANLAGGRGGLAGTVIGALILNLVGDAVFLLGLTSYWQFVAQGVILIGIVSAAGFGVAASEAER